MKKILKIMLTKINQVRSNSPLTNPKRLLDVKYISGKPGDCGIACIAMLTNLYGGEINEDWASFKTDENYIPEIGWKHGGLVSIANKATQRKFKRFSYMNINFVKSQIDLGKPVVCSVSVPDIDNLDQKELYLPIDSEKKTSKHMILAIGFNGNSIIVHDPRDIGIYSKNLKIPNIVFSKIFNGNGIVLNQ